MHQYPARLVELDPQTGKPKRKQYVKPEVVKLNMQGTPKTVRLCEVSRDHRTYHLGELVFARALRLATYASNLNDGIEGKTVPRDTVPSGRESACVGELDEQRSRRANLENVASGCVRCIEAHSMGEALTRLGSLFGDLGIEWEDKAA